MDNDDEANTITQLTKDVRIEAVEILNLLCEEGIDSSDCLNDSDDFLADDFLDIGELTTRYKNLAHLYLFAEISLAGHFSLIARSLFSPSQASPPLPQLPVVDHAAVLVGSLVESADCIHAEMGQVVAQLVEVL